MRAVAAALFIAFVAATALISAFYIDQVRLRLETILFTMPEDWEQTQQYVTDYSEMLKNYGDNMRLSVIDLQGNVIADSGALPDALDNHADRPEVITAIEEGFGSNLRRSDTLGVFLLYAAMRQGDFVLRISVGLWDMLGAILLIGLIALACTASCGLIVYRRALKFTDEVLEPINSLTEAAIAVTSGDFGVSVGVGKDELGILANAFNGMCTQVRGSMQALKQSRMELAEVVQAMDDGVIVIGSDGRISLSNDRSGELLGCVGLGGGDKLEGIVSLMDLKEIASQASGASLNEQLKVYISPSAPPTELMVFCKLLHNDEVLCVLTDITRLKKLETMRSDFVANVSHELKTPLTSIRGYIELLQGGRRDEATAKRFYDIIDIEADRLQNMINDLLSLSEIENTGHEPLRRCDAVEVLRETLCLLSPVAEKAGVRLLCDTPDDLSAAVSPQRLKQLYINLLDNAIKYNKPGGQAKITLSADKSNLMIEVSDTGIGIESQHCDRLFERFYRVDKSRSRENGGTGLGLSIVKHIAVLYGGDVRLQSTPGEGTTFYVRLKN